jgi:putative cardiolipin synthase
MKALNNYLVPICILVTSLSACTSSSTTNALAEQECIELTYNPEQSVSDEIAGFDSLLSEKTGVYVLEDGANALVQRAWLTQYSEATIDIQYFIFSTDNVGLIACDYLVRAADRGVKIRILVDDIMVDAELEDILMLDSHENINIKIYNPGVNLGKSIISKVGKFATDFRSANQRMHNKTFIVDQKVAITGGRNIAEEYFDFDREYNFRDRDVLLLGKTVAVMNNSFNEFWESELSVDVIELAADDFVLNTAQDRFDALHSYACNPLNFWSEIRQRISGFPGTLHELSQSRKLLWVDSIQFISDEPGKNQDESGLGGGGATTTALLDLVSQAKHSIDIQSPYLITTALSRDLFKAAVDRGVRIRILTNSLSSTDNLEAFSGYKRDRAELLATGVEIYEFRPDAAIRKKIMTSVLQKEIEFAPIFGLHAKSMVIDNEISVIGTFNLDPRSANLNTECIVVAYSKEIANGVSQAMEEEFKPENAWHTTLDYNPDEFAGMGKNIQSWTRKIVPKGVL